MSILFLNLFKVNSPLIETNSPHNTIEVLGMYLTKDEDVTDDEVLICSGEDDTDDSD